MLLRGKGLAVHFAGVAAIDGVDIDLRPGEIKGLIGPNGAGKTTLMNALSGFVPLTRGEISLDGRPVTRWSPQRLARMGMSRTFQHARVFRRLSVRENIEVAALGVGQSRREARRRADRVLDWLDLGDRAASLAEELSFGEEQRVGIGRALATAPGLLLLDEPAAGLDEAESDRLMDLVATIRQRDGCGILIIEHDMRLVMNVCDSVHVLDNGQTIAAGSPAAVQEDAQVRAAYLGEPGRTSTLRAVRPPARRDVPDILEVEGLGVAYGNVPALKGVTLNVSPGELVGVVGPNGAGKSTLLLSIAGVLKPRTGVIRLDGHDVMNASPETMVSRGISLVPERRRIFANLTVEENLAVVAVAPSKGERRAAIAGIYERFPMLEERRHSRGSSLSGGQQQLLAIARALMARPRLLLVDEPSLGLAPLLVEQVFGMLRALREEGVAILLVEQNALATIEMSDRVYLLRRGAIEHASASQDDAERKVILASYMERIGLANGGHNTGQRRS